MTSDKPITYTQAGVNIAAGNELVSRIKPFAQQTMRPGVLAGLGGFGALFELPIANYKAPVLVSGTDGVGTKLKLAIDTNSHQGIGIDLVAMCANDIVVCGAEPLFFLDYYATGQLDVAMAEVVIKSIAEGCHKAGMALVGGETAEMPGMYQAKDYDLAGFAVGIVEKSAIIDGSEVQPGDSLIALASSGAHANGYSLIRKILTVNNTDYHKVELDNRSLIDHLLQPTEIYVKPILRLLESQRIHAIAHITGGGITENLPRVLPEHTVAKINTSSWEWPALFTWLQQQGNVPVQEMYRTFNCGVGMIVCVSPDTVPSALQLLALQGIKAWELGHVETSNELKAKVVFSYGG